MQPPHMKKQEIAGRTFQKTTFHHVKGNLLERNTWSFSV